MQVENKKDDDPDGKRRDGDGRPFRLVARDSNDAVDQRRGKRYDWQQSSKDHACAGSAGPQQVDEEEPRGAQRQEPGSRHAVFHLHVRHLDEAVRSGCFIAP